MRSLRGQLLVASPALLDPNFRRTVVLIGEHGEEGAMGLVLNRPSVTTVAEAVPDLDGVAHGSDPVYVGGPVAPSVIMVLAEFDEPDEAGMLVARDLGFLGEAREINDLGASTRGARVFAGYAGWGPGQLDEEVKRSDWIVNAPEAAEILSEEPEELWPAVLDRMGGQFSLLARMPPDPSMN